MTTSSTYTVTHYPRCVLWGKQLTRPTTSFARGCKLWSKERQFYEDTRRSNMIEFSDRPYLHKQYPEIGKHYPGTWRVVNSGELDDIVARLTKTTTCHTARASYIRERSAYVRHVVDTEKAKDIVARTSSAQPRLEGNSAYSGLSARQSFRRYYQEVQTPQERTSAPAHAPSRETTSAALPRL